MTRNAPAGNQHVTNAALSDILPDTVIGLPPGPLSLKISRSH
jgi:hypothetical protein